MKKQFYGFYEPEKEEVDKVWEQGIFIFDTNTLLNLYRYTENTRKDFLSAITKLSERLFLPYQVGFEYHSNRYSVIESINDSYDKLIKSITENFEKTIPSIFNPYLRHPSIQVNNLNKITIVR